MRFHPGSRRHVADDRQFAPDDLIGFSRAGGCGLPAGATRPNQIEARTSMAELGRRRHVGEERRALLGRSRGYSFARKRLFANAMPEPDLKYSSSRRASARCSRRHKIEELPEGTSVLTYRCHVGEKRSAGEDRRSIQRKCHRSSIRESTRTLNIIPQALKLQQPRAPQALINLSSVD